MSGYIFDKKLEKQIIIVSNLESKLFLNKGPWGALRKGIINRKKKIKNKSCKRQAQHTHYILST